MQNSRHYKEDQKTRFSDFPARKAHNSDCVSNNLQLFLIIV